MVYPIHASALGTRAANHPEMVSWYEWQVRCSAEIVVVSDLSARVLMPSRGDRTAKFNRYNRVRCYVGVGERKIMDSRSR